LKRIEESWVELVSSRDKGDSGTTAPGNAETSDADGHLKKAHETPEKSSEFNQATVKKKNRIYRDCNSRSKKNTGQVNQKSSFA
jgi:hypothetical protein